MKYPIGIQDFEKIRRDGYVYVDKTALVYKLADTGSYYSLSRPRRLYKIGVNFFSAGRGIAEWKIAE